MKSDKKKICFVSGSRADYWLLRSLLFLVDKDSDLDLCIIATGSHLSPLYGLTYKDIESDGFIINAKVDIIHNDDSSLGVTNAISKAIKGIGEELDAIKPDIVVLLGDRYEILSAAIAALVSKVPVAHIHGGELTPNCYDDAIRHSITKMAHLHFVANSVFKKRLIQLGEQPSTIHTVGALGVDTVKKIKRLKRIELETVLGIKFKDKNLLVTFHPVTLSKCDIGLELKELLDALAELESTLILFTLPNADSDSRVIIDMISTFVTSNKNARLIKSMGQVNYFSFISHADGVVGNSSSGLLEIPSFKKGTINIGDRQNGRPCASSVINCKSRKKDILLALKKLYSKQFQINLVKTINPYGSAGAANKIYKAIKNHDLGTGTAKQFNDVIF